MYDNGEIAFGCIRVIINSRRFRRRRRIVLLLLLLMMLVVGLGSRLTDGRRSVVWVIVVVVVFTGLDNVIIITIICTIRIRRGGKGRIGGAMEAASSYCLDRYGPSGG